MTVKASLNAKAVLLSKANNSESKSVVYIKVDQPITKLNGEQWPEWAISEDWKDNNPQDYNKSIHLINHECLIMPDVTEFTKHYKASQCKFLKSMPPGADLLEDDCCRSITPIIALREDYVA